MSDGVESSDGVGSDVVVPRYRAVKTGDEMIEVPPDSSEDVLNDGMMDVVSTILRGNVFSDGT